MSFANCNILKKQKFEENEKPIEETQESKKIIPLFPIIKIHNNSAFISTRV